MKQLAFISFSLALTLAFGCSEQAQAKPKTKAKVVDGHIERPESWPPYFDCDLVRKPHTMFHADGSGTSLGEARGIARIARRAMRKQFGVDDGVLFRCRGGEVLETKATRHRGDCEENIGAYADITPEAADKTCSLENEVGKRIHECARKKALDECKKMTGKTCASLGTPYLIPSFKEDKGASCRATVWAVDPDELSPDEVDDEGFETFAFKPNFYGRKLKPYWPKGGSSDIAPHEDEKQKHVGIAVPGSTHAKLFDEYRAIELKKEACMAKRWGKRLIRKDEKYAIETACACEASEDGVLYRDHANVLERLLEAQKPRFDYVSVEFTDEEAPTPAAREKRLSFAVHAPRFYNEAVGIKHLWGTFHDLQSSCDKFRDASFLEKRAARLKREHAADKARVGHKRATYEFIDMCMPQCKDDCEGDGCLRCEEDCIAVQDAFVDCAKNDDDIQCTAVYEKIKQAKAKMK